MRINTAEVVGLANLTPTVGPNDYDVLHERLEESASSMLGRQEISDSEARAWLGWAGHGLVSHLMPYAAELFEPHRLSDGGVGIGAHLYRALIQPRVDIAIGAAPDELADLLTPDAIDPTLIMLFDRVLGDPRHSSGFTFIRGNSWLRCNIAPYYRVLRRCARRGADVDDYIDVVRPRVDLLSYIAPSSEGPHTPGSEAELAVIEIYRANRLRILNSLAVHLSG